MPLVWSRTAEEKIIPSPLDRVMFINYFSLSRKTLCSTINISFIAELIHYNNLISHGMVKNMLGLSGNCGNAAKQHFMTQFLGKIKLN